MHKVLVTEALFKIKKKLTKGNVRRVIGEEKVFPVICHVSVVVMDVASSHTLAY